MEGRDLCKGLVIAAAATLFGSSPMIKSAIEDRNLTAAEAQEARDERKRNAQIFLRQYHDVLLND